jgi:ATP-dependent DNA helicase PIF1
MTQDEALRILKTGANVFLTGEPGSGKTYTINRYVDYLRDHDIEPAITASTGIAATHIGGMTIHSWSGIGIRRDLTPYDVEYISSLERIAKRILKTKILIIDEISMLEARTLFSVDTICRAVKRNDLPFGGMQIIFVGDFFQLPPISQEGASPSLFAFFSESWRVANPLACYLSEQHRQEDSVFLEILAAVRKGIFNDSHRVHLEERKSTIDESNLAGITKLFPHNADVNRINEAELARLPGTPHAFKMKTKGAKPLVEQLQRGCLSPDTLVLKVGAKVMFTKNSFNHEFVNGSTGEVTGFREDGLPIVKIRGGRIITPSAMDWTIDDGPKILAQITQIPLRLAWAITVHKSQGVSLDAAFIDLSSAFEYGQGYVALSRVRSLAGLYLGGLNTRALEVHPEIFAEDGAFRDSSEAAQGAFAKMQPQEIARMHENFIKACGGSLKATPKKREKREKISTYQKTKELLLQKKSLEEIANSRNLDLRTILNHLGMLHEKKEMDPVRDVTYLTIGSEELIRKIHKALRQHGTLKLKPIFDHFNGEVPYETIHIARLLFQP